MIQGSSFIPGCFIDHLICQLYFFDQCISFILQLSFFLAGNFTKKDDKKNSTKKEFNRSVYIF